MKFAFCIILACALTIVGLQDNLTPPEIPRLPNGCLITAVEFQAQLSLHDNGIWSRVVGLRQMGSFEGHAVVVFSLRNGDLWFYDLNSGSTFLKTTDRSLPAIAAALAVHFPGIYKVAFLD